MSEVQKDETKGDDYIAVCALARETYRVQFAAANPGAGKEELAASWGNADKHALRRLARKTLRSMERRGIHFIVDSDADGSEAN